MCLLKGLLMSDLVTRYDHFIEFPLLTLIQEINPGRESWRSFPDSCLNLLDRIVVIYILTLDPKFRCHLSHTSIKNRGLVYNKIQHDCLYT